MFDYTPLRLMLVKKGIKHTTKYLMEEVGLHSTVTSRINSGKYISGDSLDRICQHFDCQLSDIVEIKKDPSI